MRPRVDDALRLRLARYTRGLATAMEMVMKYLSLETVGTVIELAEQCYPRPHKRKKDLAPDQPKPGQRATRHPAKRELAKFINSLTDNEKAELLALMRLGSDGGNWDQLITEAGAHVSEAGTYMAAKGFGLATALERGLEIIIHQLCCT